MFAGQSKNRILIYVAQIFIACVTFLEQHEVTIVQKQWLFLHIPGKGWWRLKWNIQIILFPKVKEWEWWWCHPEPRINRTWKLLRQWEGKIAQSKRWLVKMHSVRLPINYASLTSFFFCCLWPDLFTSMSLSFLPCLLAIEQLYCWFVGKIRDHTPKVPNIITGSSGHSMNSIYHHCYYCNCYHDHYCCSHHHDYFYFSLVK